MPINSALIEYVELLSSSPDNGETIFDILVRETNLYAEQSIDDTILANKYTNILGHCYVIFIAMIMKTQFLVASMVIILLIR